MKLIYNNADGSHEPNYMDSGWIVGICVLNTVLAILGAIGWVINILAIYNGNIKVPSWYIPSVIIGVIVGLIAVGVWNAILYRIVNLSDEANALNDKMIEIEGLKRKVAELEAVQQRRTEWVNSKLRELETDQRKKAEMEYDLNAKITELEIAQERKWDE